VTELYEYIAAGIRVTIIFTMVMGIIPVMIWMERKGAAYIQDRRGPNRAQILGIRLGGLIHSLADALKLFTKTEITGNKAVRPLFLIAPLIAMSISVIIVAVIPFAQPTQAFGIPLSLQAVDLSGGLIFVVAFSSLSVYALLLAGWASSGKYTFLGALRAASQMISYELSLALAVAAIFLVAGSFKLTDIVIEQGVNPLTWNFIRQPLAFLIFMVALFAETNRLPFDLPEGESELVAGYHTEYSSMRFAMFFMGEYAHIVVGSLIITTVFLGGWQIPFIDVAQMMSHIDITLCSAGLIAGIPLTLLGLILLKRYKRRYLDARDFEVLVFGLPSLALGLALIIGAGYALWGSRTLLPDAAYIVVFLIQLAVVFAKTMACASIFIWVRWTLPRFRYDQLMRLGWKVLLPLGLLNLIATAGILLVV
jgi:NADH-quinone oxidoreductase subunit H